MLEALFVYSFTIYHLPQSFGSMYIYAKPVSGQYCPVVEVYSFQFYKCMRELWDTLVQIICNTYIAMNGTSIVTLTGIIFLLYMVIHPSSRSWSIEIFDSKIANAILFLWYRNVVEYQWFNNVKPFVFDDTHSHTEMKREKHTLWTMNDSTHERRKWKIYRCDVPACGLFSHPMFG